MPVEVMIDRLKFFIASWVSSLPNFRGISIDMIMHRWRGGIPCHDGLISVSLGLSSFPFCFLFAIGFCFCQYISLVLQAFFLKKRNPWEWGIPYKYWKTCTVIAFRIKKDDKNCALWSAVLSLHILVTAGLLIARVSRNPSVAAYFIRKAGPLI